MSYVLEVYFPEVNTTSADNPASIDLWNALALSFFLEALYKGSALFNARPFRIVASDTDKIPYEIKAIRGQGVYEVRDRELIVHEEGGEIAGIIAGAWQEMKKRIGQK